MCEFNYLKYVYDYFYEICLFTPKTHHYTLLSYIHTYAHLHLNNLYLLQPERNKLMFNTVSYLHNLGQHCIKIGIIQLTVTFLISINATCKNAIVKKRFRITG